MAYEYKLTDLSVSSREEFEDSTHLTKTYLVVHAASDPKGKNRTQEIDIYYKGIGALEVSKVTSSRQE